MISILFSAGFIPFIILFGSLIISLTFHEFAHGWVADRLGDPTARHQGRLSLNPLAHLDPLGTLAILFTWFGWGKPVRFDPFNLKDPRRDAALIGLAGPTSNFILAVLAGILLHILPLPSILYVTFIAIVRLNLALGLFNLIPIHPLDGGKILIGFLPHDLAMEWNEILHQYGMIILLFLIFPLAGTSPVSALITPILNTLMSILVP